MIFIKMKDFYLRHHGDRKQTNDLREMIIEICKINKELLNINKKRQLQEKN